MALVHAERIAPKGGSIRFVIQREAGPRKIDASVERLISEEIAAGLYDDRIFGAFNAEIARLGKDIRARLARSRDVTGRALAYGASVGCAALIHYFDLGEIIDAIFDDQPLTNVVRTSTRDIPVLSGKQLANEGPSEVVVLAWRYASPIARGQQAFQQAGGRFFRALPDLAYVDGGDNTAPSA